MQKPKYFNLTVTPNPVSPYLREAFHKPMPSAPIKKPTVSIVRPQVKRAKL